MFKNREEDAARSSEQTQTTEGQQSEMSAKLFIVIIIGGLNFIALCWALDGNVKKSQRKTGRLKSFFSTPLWKRLQDVLGKRSRNRRDGALTSLLSHQRPVIRVTWPPPPLVISRMRPVNIYGTENGLQRSRDSFFSFFFCFHIQSSNRKQGRECSFKL